MVLAITVSSTCSAVVAIWTTAVAYVVVSGVLLKVMLLLGDSTMSARFLFIYREFTGASASFPFFRGMEFWVIKV